MDPRSTSDESPNPNGPARPAFTSSKFVPPLARKRQATRFKQFATIGSGVVLASAIAVVGFLALRDRGVIRSSAANPVQPAKVTVMAPTTKAVSTELVEVAPVAKTSTDAPTAKPAAVQPDIPITKTVLATAQAVPVKGRSGPAPFFGPNYNATDGKPVFVCGGESDSAFTLIQMQMTGKDVAHGFHLGIVPMQFGGEYSMSEETHVKLMQDGAWDCMVERVDEDAELNMGIITGIVDESAGRNGIWARGNLKSYEDLKGKRVGYVDKTSSRFFMLYTLNIMSPEDQKTVQAQSFDTIGDAIAAFNEGKIDAVSGWEPYLSQTAAKGGKPLITTEQLRVIVHALMTSRPALANKAGLVQSFHEAWFDTLKVQIEDVDGAAKSIAAWGNNNWTTISPENAATDLRARLKDSAQATLSQNAGLADNAAPIMNILQTSRDLWVKEMTDNKEELPAEVPPIETLVDFRFVQALASKTALQTSVKPVNNTFSLRAAPASTAVAQDTTKPAPTSVAAATVVTPTAQPTQPVVAAKATPVVEVTAEVSQTLAVLPCRKFTFLPNSAELTAESIRVLNVCVIPTLQQRAGLFLTVKGSAAWPGPAGTFTKDQIKGFAASRAKAIVDYLISQKIDSARLSIEGITPPEDHWETLDSAKQAEDRWVEMTLVTTGW